jgi:serine/threonine protein phosphatase PrpC
MSPLALLRSLVARSEVPTAPRLVARACGRTTTGRRSTNQDRLVVRDDLGLYAVADGMGGYQGGEVASQTTIDALVARYEAHRRDEEDTWPFVPDAARTPSRERARTTASSPAETLSLESAHAIVAVETAHRAVREKRRGELAQMGSTVVMLARSGARLVVAHAGDSRAVLLRDGVLHALTRDHSFMAELESRGTGTAEERERMAAQFGHVVTKAIGHGEQLAPTVLELEVQKGDVFLLSSDGLHGVLDAEEIAHTLALFAPEDASEILLARAIEAGSTDNVTAVVVRIETL